MVALYVPPWLRGTALEQVYIDAWVESGDVTAAREAVRESPTYDEVFAGNRREDGTVRYDEALYLSVKESYADALLSVNVNPDLMEYQFGNLIQGNVSPAEFAARVDSLYTQVIDQVPEIAEYYNANFGTALSTSGVVASFLDPTLGQQIINGQIAMAQVGGSAAKRGFNIATEFAQQLVHAGLDSTSEAAQFFSLAEGALPTLNALAARHADPDDDFDLGEFAQAQVFNDPQQRARVQRLLAQDRSTFTSSAGLSVVQNQAGGSSGLADR
jgi:hypothetical protein